jgi:hypothetical protein
MTSEPRIVGRGWATVELDRAAAERRGDLAPGAAFEPADRSAALGATCLRGRVAGGDGWIVLLEPDTEGPISGFLARHGEGWAATWVAADPTADQTTDRPTHQPTDQPPDLGPGPIGPETLEPGTPRFGPFRLRADAATIEP